MKEIQSHKDLIVWQKAMLLCTEVYRLTEKFPRHEIFGITSQMRRAAVSIPSNIAEGKNRSSAKDFANFLRIAYGSTSELEMQLDINKRLMFMNESEYKEVEGLLIEVSKMLHVMIKRLSVS